MVNYRIYPNVEIGNNCVIEDFAIIGIPPRNNKDGELKTVIGNNSHIRNGTVIYAGAKIGNNFKSGDHAIIRENCVIGDNVVIGNHCLILPYANIGNSVVIHSLCLTCEYVEIGNNSWLGPGVITLNTLYPKAYFDPEKNIMDKEGAVKIGKYVRIGGNVTINPFVTLGDYVIVGAGSVVTKSIPENKVVVGNPARIIKNSDEITARYNNNVRPYDKKYLDV